MEEKVMEFALDDVLREKQINKRQAAVMCGLSYPTVWNIASNNQTNISLLTIQKLCVGLDVAPNDLFRWVK